MSSPVRITGVGVVCAAGWGFASLTEAIADGSPRIETVRAFPTTRLRTHVAGEVPGLPDGMPTGDRVRRITRAALAEALGSAGLAESNFDPRRTSLVVGTSQGTGWTDGPPHLGFLSDPCHQMAREVGITGLCLVVSTACTASTNAIAIGFDMLNDGEVDLAVVGGFDGLSRSTFAGFNAMRSLDPGPCSPYTRSLGLTIGEGAAFLVLERPESAEQRGAEPYADLLSYGASADAYHPTAPDPSGAPAARAMLDALSGAEVDSRAVHYVNGHGTGTPANDAMELRALRLVFHDRDDPVSLSSTKAMLGHTLGAAGAVETATCLAGLCSSRVPSNAHLGPEIDLDRHDHDHEDANTRHDAVDLVRRPRASSEMSLAMSVNFGFGGTNTALLVGRPRSRRIVRAAGERAPIVMSGVGILTAAGADVDSFADAVWSGRSSVEAIADGPRSGFSHAAFDPEPPDLEAVARGSWRRMDRFARLCLAAAWEATSDAGLRRDDADASARLVLVATDSGPVDTITRFNRSVAASFRVVNPALFVNSSPSAACGYLSVILRARGAACAFPIGGIGAHLALARAMSLLRHDRARQVVVVAADHLCAELLDAASAAGIPAAPPDPFGRCHGTSLGGGAVAFVLEREDLALGRGAACYARVISAGFARPDVDGLSGAFGAAMSVAAQGAAIPLAEIGYVVAAARGILQSDGAEAQALLGCLGGHAVVGATTHLTGTCLSASGAVNVAVAALALSRRGVAPFEPAVPRFALPFPSHDPDRAIEHALVNAYDRSGSVASLVLQRASS